MGENIFDGRATIDGNGTRKAQGKSGMLSPETCIYIKLDFGNGALSSTHLWSLLISYLGCGQDVLVAEESL